MVRKVAFIGAMTGDEGKGVRVAYYAKEFAQWSNLVDDRTSLDSQVWVTRWQGGGNAGHTVEIGGTKYALHQIPSGILVPKVYNLMGEGVFLNPRESVAEIKKLTEKGVRVTPDNFGIASNCHVTLDYHVKMDKEDSSYSNGNHLSTGRGIKPTAVDKVGRVGIRFEEFLDHDSFVEALRHRFPDGMPEKETYKQFSDSYAKEREVLKRFSALQSKVLNDPKFRVGIGEGAQGFQLDVDRGLYPGVTSSNPTLPPFRTEMNVGVVKMYQSSVGGGRPFIGQIGGELEGQLREVWGEKGTTTGKPRNLGWLDAVALRHAVESCELDFLVSTCGDRLEELADRGETVKLVTGYKIDGKVFDEWDRKFHDRRVLHSAEPVFEKFKPWKVFFDKEKGELSHDAERFVNRVEELAKTRFIAHGYGPEINDVHELEPLVTQLL